MNGRRLATAALPLLAFAGPVASQQSSPKSASARPEPVADTQLLMDGLAKPNFRGLDKILSDRPADAEAWSFARGQALLIAETANLLMLRPPKSSGQDIWLERAAALRASASRLARHAADRDFPRSRAAFAEVANACNRCHESFRVAARVVPFAGDAQ